MKVLCGIIEFLVILFLVLVASGCVFECEDEKCFYGEIVVDCDDEIEVEAEVEEVDIYCHRDKDGDGFGSLWESDMILATEAFIGGVFICQSGFVLNNEDCHDLNDTIFPSAEELCDGLDNNCDGEVDEGCEPPVEAEAEVYCRPDQDGDGYGGHWIRLPLEECPIGFVGLDEPEPFQVDCDDDDPGIYPGATEYCYDDIDSDCDGYVDTAFGGCYLPTCSIDIDCRHLRLHENYVYQCLSGVCDLVPLDI